MACLTSADCVEVSDGCCFGSTIISMPDDYNWGLWDAVYEETDFVPEIGYTYMSCTTLRHQEAQSGDMSAYDSLAASLAVSTPDELALFDLVEGDTVDDAIFYSESDE